MSQWHVVLEWAICDGEPLGADANDLRAVLNALAEFGAVALCNPDRYVIQLQVTGATAPEAVATALGRYAEAAADRLPTDGWRLARVELLTSEELEEQWTTFEASAEGNAALRSFAGDDVAEAIATAMSDLDSARTAADARAALVRVVRQLGGGIVAARLQDEWTLPLDISLGVGDPAIPVAEPWSMARIRLEEALPALLEKARSVCQRLQFLPAVATDPSSRT